MYGGCLLCPLYPLSHLLNIYSPSTNYRDNTHFGCRCSFGVISERLGKRQMVDSGPSATALAIFLALRTAFRFPETDPAHVESWAVRPAWLDHPFTGRYIHRFYYRYHHGKGPSMRGVYSSRYTSFSLPDTVSCLSVSLKQKRYSWFAGM